MSALTPPTTTRANVPALKPEHVDAIADAAAHAHSASTRRNYSAAWKRFTAWTEQEGHTAKPAAPETVAAYLTVRAASGLSIASLRIDAAAVRHAHESAGLANPCAHVGVKRVLRGLTRMAAQAGHTPQQAAALTLEGLAAIRATACQPRTGPSGRTESTFQAIHRGQVDVALAATMLDGLLRRGEAAALTWADIEFLPDGSARLTIRRSKADQDGEGAVQYLSRATARALKRCRALTDTGDDGTSVFGIRHGSTIARRLQRMAKAAGLDGRITGHSARVGMCRALVAAGESVAAVQVAGRWKSSRMPAHYARGEIAGQGAVARLHGEG